MKAIMWMEGYKMHEHEALYDNICKIQLVIVTERINLVDVK
jgi:hypothetical protein